MTQQPEPQDAPPFEIAVVPVTPFQQNASILWDSASKKAAIVDPGGDIARLKAVIERFAVIPEKILLTHAHIDHAGGAAELAALLGIPIEGPHRADQIVIDELGAKGLQFGIEGARAFVPDRWLEEGDTVTVGDVSFDVLHVPGHTPGHVVFVNPEARFAIVGDTVFQGSIGRTDFAYGDGPLLVRGIREKLLPLGDDMTVLPGHGPATTLGDERRTNPFLRG